jgi:hypothetical protein
MDKSFLQSRINWDILCSFKKNVEKAIKAEEQKLFDSTISFDELPRSFVGFTLYDWSKNMDNFITLSYLNEDNDSDISFKKGEPEPTLWRYIKKDFKKIIENKLGEEFRKRWYTLFLLDKFALNSKKGSLSESYKHIGINFPLDKKSIHRYNYALKQTIPLASLALIASTEGTIGRTPLKPFFITWTDPKFRQKKIKNFPFIQISISSDIPRHQLFEASNFNWETIELKNEPTFKGISEDEFYKKLAKSVRDPNFSRIDLLKKFSWMVSHLIFTNEIAINPEKYFCGASINLSEWNKFNQMTIAIIPSSEIEGTITALYVIFESKNLKKYLNKLIDLP